MRLRGLSVSHSILEAELGLESRDPGPLALSARPSHQVESHDFLIQIWQGVGSDLQQ